MDMMQNSTITHHVESITEAQIICLVSIVTFADLLDWYHLNTDSHAEESHGENIEIRALIGILLFEHVFSYICAYYRRYEILARGVPDVNGILRAKNEYKLWSI
jgi:uncharacterized membrane protein YoaT (DUF817 family)